MQHPHRYAFNIIFNIMNKTMLNAFPCPYFISTWQLGWYAQAQTTRHARSLLQAVHLRVSNGPTPTWLSQSFTHAATMRHSL